MISWTIKHVDPDIAQEYADWAFSFLALRDVPSTVTIIETDDGREYPNVDLSGVLFPGYEQGSKWPSGETAENMTTATSITEELVRKAIDTFGGSYAKS